MLRLSTILVFVAACGSGSSKPTPAPSAPADAAALRAAAAAPDTLSIIAPLWPDGCFTAHDGTRVVTSDAARCAKPRRPYSTFKVANALIAVDAGVLTGAESAMTWDKKKIATSPSWTEAMRRPQTLRTGMAVSAVPYFRTLALQLGEARMSDGLKRLDYGNQDISGGLDRFWLTGGIRISADQQLAFMTRLAAASVPGFKPESQRVVREVMQLDERGGAVLFGKTGSGSVEDREGAFLVWLVGWVERDGKTLPFAAWLEVEGGTFDEARAARDTRVRATLDALGWIPKKPPA